MVSLWPQWHGRLSTAASGSFWKCGVQLLCEACRAELEPLTLLQLLLSGGTAVILLDGFWDQHQCRSTSNLGKNVGHVHLPFSRSGFVNLTAESDSPHLVGGCVYPGENPTFLTLWVLRTHIYQCKGLGEQGGGKIHMDKVIKLLLWHTFLEECWKIFSLMRIWAENFTMWFPEWFLNPALGPAMRRVISSGTEELHLWSVSAAGAESLNAQRWSQSPALCSYSWSSGSRWLFFCKLHCSWMFSWGMKTFYEEWFQVTLLLFLCARSP